MRTRKYDLRGLYSLQQSEKLWTERGEFLLKRAESCKKTNKKLSLVERGKALKCFKKALASYRKMINKLW